MKLKNSKPRKREVDPKVKEILKSVLREVKSFKLVSERTAVLDDIADLILKTNYHSNFSEAEEIARKVKEQIRQIIDEKTRNITAEPNKDITVSELTDIFSHDFALELKMTTNKIARIYLLKIGALGAGAAITSIWFSIEFGKKIKDYLEKSKEAGKSDENKH